MDRRIIVAIAGQKRVGKDTVADRLCERHGFTNMKISGPLKDGIMHMFGFSREQVESDLKDEVDEFWDIEPRRVMQWLGTDIFQHRLRELFSPPHPPVGRLFWMRQLERRLLASTGHVVVSDVRFDHELRSLEAWADASDSVTLVTLRLSRDSVTVSAPNHESEECRLTADHHMTNNGSVSDLHESVDRLIDEVRH